MIHGNIPDYSVPHLTILLRQKPHKVSLRQEHKPPFCLAGKNNFNRKDLGDTSIFEIERGVGWELVSLTRWGGHSQGATRCFQQYDQWSSSFYFVTLQWDIKFCNRLQHIQVWPRYKKKEINHWLKKTVNCTHKEFMCVVRSPLPGNKLMY